MNHLTKYLIILLTSFTFGHACAICSVDVPTVDVSVHVNQEDDKSLTYAIKWKFHETFTKEAFIPYDKNSNKQFEASELEEIKKTFLDYLENVDFLTYIKYFPKDVSYKKVDLIDFSLHDVHVYKQDANMYFTYIIKQPILLEAEKTLYIRFYDPNGFFNFITKSASLSGYDGAYTTQITYNGAKLLLSHDTQVNSEEEIKALEENNQNIFLRILSKQMENISQKLNTLLNSIKDGESFISYLWLFLFSFLYGIIHAIGPGHGKTLVSAYFLSENKSYFKALNMSALIGVIHTLSAFILTFIVYYILNNYLGMYLQSVEKTSIKISAIIIILIAVYLLYKKLRPKKVAYTFSKSESIILRPNSQQHAMSCGCSACKTNSTDLGVIISAGIVPCPGTVTIFIFTMSLGLYWVGVFAAAFMSLGMSLIIFIMAYLSIGVRHKAQNFPWLVKALEYASLVFILALGLILALV